MTELIDLYAGQSSVGVPVREQLPAERKSEKIFVLGVAPLLALGVAAGDTIFIEDESDGIYRVVERSGNLAIQLFTPNVSDSIVDAFGQALGKLGGRIDRREKQGLSGTVHFTAGFKRIAESLDNLVERFKGAEWYYGNVYDPVDGTTPLGWWDSMAQ